MASSPKTWLQSPATRAIATVVVLVVLGIMVVNLYCWATGGCNA